MIRFPSKDDGSWTCQPPPVDDDGLPIAETIEEFRARVTPPQSGGEARLIWYGDAPPAPPQYLVDETLPEVGVAILGGQFGAAKTFVGADLGGAVVVGGEFSGQAVRRKGGVLWLAAEGESEIETRVRAAISARGGDVTQRQPFARQAGAVPCLTDKEAPERLKTLAALAAERLRKEFGCELALIAIDTLSAAAGFDDENSAAETQKVMTTFAALARETKTLVLLIDHYGKLVDTGVRGSSAKSAAADAILACLGDRDQATGAISNRRLAVTKLRAGPTGRVVPFKLAQTADGLTCTVNWQTDAAPETAPPKGKQWPKALVIFRRVLENTIGDAGQRIRPFPDGPEIVAARRDAVRAEFMKSYPADSRKAKGMAFGRCEKEAIAAGLIVAREIGPAESAATFFWPLAAS